METSFLARWSRVAALGVAVIALMACGISSTVAAAGTATPSSTPTPVATATATPAPTATPTPAPGVCNAADFPTKTSGGPSPFTYPPLSYYYEQSPGAGNHPSVMCSSGNPTSILTFMKSSVPAAGWKITGTTATTLAAEAPTSPPSGFCYTVNITVGQSASYPGEWNIDFHPPAGPCV